MNFGKKLVLTISFFIILQKLIFGNVMPQYMISEFVIDSSGWQIEIGTVFDTLQFDSNAYITSSIDTAYFKDEIIFVDTTGSEDWEMTHFPVITDEYLKSELMINMQQDTVMIHGLADTNYYPDILFTLSFGYSDFPPAPKVGQSICYNNGNAYSTYLDNSPTLGYANDTLDATGNLKVQIVDSNDDPLHKIYCYMCHHINPSVYIADSSNESGIIYLNLLSGSHNLYFSNSDTLKGGTEFLQYSNVVERNIIIYPQESKSINVKIPDSILSDIGSESRFQKSASYRMSANYPNPFNNSTGFNYRIPINDYVEINLYDMQGRLVKSIESGFRRAGQYKLNMDFSGLCSGIYFYRLETGNKTITRKCMYIK